MKKALLCLGILFCLLTNPLLTQDVVKGKWKAEVQDEMIWMRLRVLDGDDFNNGWTYSSRYNKSDFSGLQWDKEHTFKMMREAGTIVFHGKFTGDKGSGDFTFQADQRFERFLKDTLKTPQLQYPRCRSRLHSKHS